MDTYTTVSGDTWDMIAYNALGNEKYAGKLMEANWNLLEYTVFPAGINVIIPDIDIEEEEDLPDWRD